MALSILGHSLTDYKNKSAIEYFKNLYQSDLTDFIQIAKTTNEPVCMSLQIDTLKRSISGIIYKCDTQYGIILLGVSDEINKIVKHTDSQILLKAVLDSSDNGIVLLTPDFRVVAFNKAAQRLNLTMINKELQIGTNFSEYLCQKDNKMFNDAFQNAVKGECFSGDMDVLFKDQTHYFRI